MNRRALIAASALLLAACVSDGDDPSVEDTQSPLRRSDLKPGDQVDREGASVVVPLPGEGVITEAIFMDGHTSLLRVETSEDGTVWESLESPLVSHDPTDDELEEEEDFIEEDDRDARRSRRGGGTRRGERCRDRRRRRRFFGGLGLTRGVQGLGLQVGGLQMGLEVRLVLQRGLDPLQPGPSQRRARRPPGDQRHRHLAKRLQPPRSGEREAVVQGGAPRAALRSARTGPAAHRMGTTSWPSARCLPGTSPWPAPGIETGGPSRRTSSSTTGTPGTRRSRPTVGVGSASTR